jgi:hypothetical protein
MSGLPGMKDICKHCNRSPATILAWIRDRDFPATKIGGSWESDTDLIDDWRRKQIRDDIRARNKRRGLKK